MQSRRARCVKFITFLIYPAAVAEQESTIDLEEVVRVLVSLGVSDSTARAQLAAADTDTDRLAEAALLAVESDATVLISNDMPLPVALFELVDGLRQAGLAVSVGSTAQAELAIAFEGPRPSIHELSVVTGATARDIVRAVANVVPRTHHVVLAASGVIATDDSHAPPDALPVLILDRGTYVSFSAAVGDGGLDRIFARPGTDAGLVTWQLSEAPLLPPDFQARAALHPPPTAATDIDAVYERICNYDPRIPWPADRERPPGDDFYEFCQALAAAPLARCLSNQDAGPLAQLLYRFALVTLVGAHSDLLAARHNPGMSAHGLIGSGQLTWAYFILDALGATAEAERAGKLLDQPWVQAQERGRNLASPLRQRAYYDLARFLRTSTRTLALARLNELTALNTRVAWQNPVAVAAALAVHTEPFGDQLTHHPLYYAWPAPLYALARRASATELLPKDNPFLRRPLFYSLIDQRDGMVVRMHDMLARFDALDPAMLPPLLDPLPVIVEVAITHVEGDSVHGHTLLSAHDDAEHLVVADAAGRAIKPGEIWLLEVQRGVRSTRQEQHADLGPVSCAIALPTGEWLEKA
jgi:hypothetical protein